MKYFDYFSDYSHSKSLTFINVFCVIFISLLYFFDDSMKGDMIMFITPAIQFLKYGSFSELINWPSGNMMPGFEAYTDFSPGITFLLLPFLYIFKNQFLSSFLLHLILTIYSIFLIKKSSENLNLSTFSSISLILLFVLLPNFVRIHMFLIPEQVFIASNLYILSFFIKNKGEQIEIKPFLFLLFNLVLSSMMKYIGVFNVGIILLYLLLYKRNYTKLFLLSIASILPPILWFIRNYLSYGYITYSHKLGKKDPLQAIENSSKLIQSIDIFSIIIIIVLIIISCIFLAFPYLKKKFYIFSAKDYSLMFFAFLLNALGIIAMSLITDFSQISARLSAPSMAFLLLLLVFYFNGFRFDDFNKKFKPLINLAKLFVIIIILISLTYDLNTMIKNYTQHIQKYPSIYRKPSFEYYLWNEILNNYINSKNPSHFYCDFYIKHQLYCEIPMRVVYNERNLDSSYVVKLKSLGNSPFFIFRNDNNAALERMETLVAKKVVKKIDFTKYGFQLYY